MLPLSFCLFRFPRRCDPEGLLLFLDLLAGQVFDRDLVELYALDGFCDFFSTSSCRDNTSGQFPHAGLGGGAFSTSLQRPKITVLCT